MRLAALLLLVGGFRHYGWHLVPAELAGIASKGLGGLAMLALLAIVWRRVCTSRIASAVLAWWAWEESQVSLCSLLYAIAPWPVAQGQAICSARVGFDLEAIGLLIVAVLAWYLASSDSVGQPGGKAE